MPPSAAEVLAFWQSAWSHWSQGEGQTLTKHSYQPQPDRNYPGLGYDILFHSGFSRAAMHLPLAHALLWRTGEISLHIHISLKQETQVNSPKTHSFKDFLHAFDCPGAILEQTLLRLILTRVQWAWWNMVLYCLMYLFTRTVPHVWRTTSAEILASSPNSTWMKSVVLILMNIHLEWIHRFYYRCYKNVILKVSISHRTNSNVSLSLDWGVPKGRHVKLHLSHG